MILTLLPYLLLLLFLHLRLRPNGLLRLPRLRTRGRGTRNLRTVVKKPQSRLLRVRRLLLLPLLKFLTMRLLHRKVNEVEVDQRDLPRPEWTRSELRKTERGNCVLSPQLPRLAASELERRN